ncbi:hypothetical protein [Longimicrobium terrae]|uniref:YncE family protein n=1 Tax=Longimicrobium terrae TaxID=1639882 RepID=A0A841GXP4_9BACT|nr:hypothetical protein [Longimicrobium terrae]MBB4636124.1 hypothetical protein [Longimicrobium terrae]MBB6070519.1 hypothetical protein [Longimicrobium terrae]NNC29509.1 hypothetical protein [Longimicrobium terrae]
MQNRFVRRLFTFAALAGLTGAAACLDDDSPNLPQIQERLVVVVNSIDRTLSLVPRDGDAGVAIRTVGLGAQGTPVDVAVLGTTAVVPMGTYPFAAVVDLRTGTVRHNVPLPANSGATGVAFLNDTLAMVANPGRNTVSTVRTVSGTAGPEIAVGTYPSAITVAQNQVFILNSNLVNFNPAGPGSITVLNSNLVVTKTIPLTGVNPVAAVAIGTRLYVLNSGSYSTPSGSLSVIDMTSLTEVEHRTGFGAAPTALEVGPGPVLFVGGYGLGVFAYDPFSNTFPISQAGAIKPGGSTAIADVEFDPEGRLLISDYGSCTDRGFLYRLTGPSTLDRTVRTGICPVGMAFADIFEED